MGINKSWQSTHSFRKFRAKTHELSKVYWLQQMGVDCTRALLVNKDAALSSVKELKCSYDYRMYPATVEETLSWLDTYMDRNRLYLLVVYTAFLESYLKEIAFFFIATKDYLVQPKVRAELLSLNPIGKAMGAPIIERSSVPNMLKYATSLFGVDLGKNAREWTKIYQLRCEVAHNGGIATPGFLKQISGLDLQVNPKEYEMLGLTWDELRSFMKSADEIAATIDSSVSCSQILALEVEQVVRELFILNRMPRQDQLWRYLYEEYAMKVKKSDQKRLEKLFY